MKKYNLFKNNIKYIHKYNIYNIYQNKSKFKNLSILYSLVSLIIIICIIQNMYQIDFFHILNLMGNHILSIFNWINI